ncbi:MAG: hypothetical protein MRJ92_09015 [Nitrospira sp.]|nr:hypothetical protein [Nitrospira sp.]
MNRETGILPLGSNRSVLSAGKARAKTRADLFENAPKRDVRLCRRLPGDRGRNVNTIARHLIELRPASRNRPVNRKDNTSLSFSLPPKSNRPSCRPKFPAKNCNSCNDARVVAW